MNFIFEHNGGEFGERAFLQAAVYEHHVSSVLTLSVGLSTFVLMRQNNVQYGTLHFSPKYRCLLQISHSNEILA